MRLMMASMLPWARYRETYGEAIVQRELVRRRLGYMAGLITASDALVAWCSTLIDAGYRGEMECIVAKIFGSEAQKESAIDMFMKTHGGRSFLHGHLFGDNVHEYLAPCIYEGEGEMLGMAFFKSLVKQHGTVYFEPIGKALHELGVRKPNPLNPAHLWALKGPLMSYGGWYLKQSLRFRLTPDLPTMPASLRQHVEFACDRLQRSGLEISAAMRKHQLKLADRQCRMSELSLRIQMLVTILCTSLHAGTQQDECIQTAGDVICRDLTRKLLGERPTDRDFRQVTQLGEAIAEGGFQSIAGLQPDQIMMPYEN